MKAAAGRNRTSDALPAEPEASASGLREAVRSVCRVSIRRRFSSSGQHCPGFHGGRPNLRPAHVGEQFYAGAGTRLAAIGRYKPALSHSDASSGQWDATGQ